MIHSGLTKCLFVFVFVFVFAFKSSGLPQKTLPVEEPKQAITMPPIKFSGEEKDSSPGWGKEDQEIRVASLRKRSTGMAYTTKNRLSNEQRARIIGQHNMLRHTEAVDNGATGMIELAWNDTLADMAEYWAENCVFEHGNRESGVFQIGSAGQNLAVSSDPNYSVEDLIEQWFNERENYDYSEGYCKEGICAHYTQLVKDYTMYMGCATAICSKLLFPSTGHTWPDSLYLVCNYDVSNIVGEKPYYTGEPCSGCQVNMLAPYKCGPETSNLCEKCSTDEDTCTNPLCEDSSTLGRYCPTWSMFGFCSDAAYYLLMKRHCRKTCMMC